MSKVEIYIYIDGREFDPAKFDASLPLVLSGEVRPIFRMSKGVKKTVGKYWRSKIRSVAESKVEAALLLVIKQYESHLRRAKATGANRIFANIVSRSAKPPRLSGLHFSRELLQALVRVGAEVDLSLPASE